MPTQWRTIAPIVGRTATQCLERYERLLDAATAGDDEYAGKEDPRRLRPGEIDPHPETKPARPDAVDMNEEEKEMLSEARARLANTKGKKAKRRAREKQLEEAKRLATLQKVREMRAAGMEADIKKKRKGKQREPDYINEVPFERIVPAGFYDVSGEKGKAKSDKDFLGKTREQIEGRERIDKEALQRKKDVAAQQQLMKQNPEKALALVAGLNEVQQATKRVKLNLPAPQVSNRELEELAKMGPGADGAGGGIGAGGAATATLLGDYGSATPASLAAGRTPARTPAMEKDAVLMEAENQARLAKLTTPLAGGENPELHPSFFGGATPAASIGATPNPLAASATPGARQGATSDRRGAAFAASMTPHRAGTSIAEHAGVAPGATPSVRDQLGINATDAWETASEAEGRAKAKTVRSGLLAALSSLPAPKNEYDVVMPDAPAEEEPADAEPMEEDAAEVDARREAAKLDAAKEELRRRSTAIRRGLPRPLALDLVKERADAPAADELAAAARAVDKEMLIALEQDAVAWPVERKKANAVQEPEKLEGVEPEALIAQAGGEARATAAGVKLVERFSPEALVAASNAIGAEVVALRAELGTDAVAPEAYAAAMQRAAEGMAYSAGHRRWAELSGLSEEEAAKAAEAQYSLSVSVLGRETKRADKLEARAATITMGLDRRCAALDKALMGEFEQLVAASRELEAFRALKANEDAAAPVRLEKLQAEVAELRKYESDLQARYRVAKDKVIGLAS